MNQPRQPRGAKDPRKQAVMADAVPRKMLEVLGYLQ